MRFFAPPERRPSMLGLGPALLIFSQALRAGGMTLFAGAELLKFRNRVMGRREDAWSQTVL